MLKKEIRIASVTKKENRINLRVGQKTLEELRFLSERYPDRKPCAIIRECVAQVAASEMRELAKKK